MDLGCPPNAAVAFDYFTGKGLRDFQAAAIVGNLQQESGLNPQVPELEKGAHGIAQWHSPRWDSLLAFAAGAGRDPWALDTQLDFLWSELPSNGLASLLASTTLEDAVVAFQDGFERCGNCVTSNRVMYARSALYSCPALKPPVTARQTSVISVAAGVIALVAAAGYGAFEARTRWRAT